MTIAVLLTCHNRCEKTLKCLRSLYDCNLPANHTIDVFLVDDGSTDGTAEAVKNGFSQVNIIQGTGNLFWNRGMHLAWEIAAQTNDYDFYIWLNDDVELFRNSIIDLLATSLENNSIAVGTTRSRNKEIATYGGRDLKDNLMVPNGIPQICNAFNGNFVLIPNNVYTVIGNLDPIFPHSIGDYDYALRAKKKGIASYIAPDYVGFCEGNASLPQWCLPKVPFKNRLRSLYSPLGNSHPYYYFQFEKRHYSISLAIIHFFTIHLRLIYPGLWKR